MLSRFAGQWLSDCFGRESAVTELVVRSGRSLQGIWNRLDWRFGVVLFLGMLLVASPGLREPVLSALSDAYLAVTVFVAGTLWVVYASEKIFKFDLGEVMVRAKHWQTPIAAALGALPGCGGAIVVVTQYARGYASFGSLVAVLISTMGDAAFLLIAREPMTGLLIMGVGFGVGTISGWIVDAVHGTKFMRGTMVDDAHFTNDGMQERKPEPIYKLWALMAIPGCVIGLLLAFQVDTDVLWGGVPLTHWFGIIGAVMCLLMWSLMRGAPNHATSNSLNSGTAGGLETMSSMGTERPMGMLERIVRDTNFVTSWVVMAFVSYEVLTYFLGAGVDSMFKVYAPLMPLIAVIVGLIPGCGPQIVVTSLYLAGAVPLSAQIGNAISNDGDALFPAIALAPRAAVLATVYSMIPALIVGYSYMFMFE